RRGRRALEGGPRGSRAGQGGVRLGDGAPEGGRVERGAGSALQGAGEVAHDGPGRDLAARVAADPVGDDREGGRRRGGVLVVRPVRPRDGPHRRHERDAHASTLRGARWAMVTVRAGATGAALLLFRRAPDGVEVLVGHMGGPFWARREAGAWTIPKGEPEPGEELHAAAVREFA